MPIKDSGSRETFITGAQRDRQPGKGRPSLVPLDVIALLSRVYEEGAKKYEARNWEKGIPTSHFLDSAFRHLAKLQSGCKDEPHASQVLWNIVGFIWTEYRAGRELPLELHDHPAELSNSELEFLNSFFGMVTPKVESLDDDKNFNEVAYASPTNTELKPFCKSCNMFREICKSCNMFREICKADHADPYFSKTPHCSECGAPF